MAWSYHDDPMYRVTTARYHAAIGTAPTVAAAYAWRDEVRHHIRRETLFETLSGVAEPVEVAGGWRATVIGRPWRAWSLGDLLRQLARQGLTTTRVVLADTHVAVGDSLTWDSMGSVLSDDLVGPSAALGTAVLDTYSGTAEGVASVGSGLRTGLPGVGAGLSDLAAGAGDLAAGVGAGAASWGAASRWVPSLTFLFVAGLGLALYLASTGALKIAPIKVGA